MKLRPSRAARILAAAALAGACGGSVACSYNSYVSTICLMSSVRNNWRGLTPADGKQLPISQYTTSYALIGVTYGGDGTRTFNLPDLRGRIPMGAGTDLQNREWAVGANGGATSVTLTTANMAAHVHPIDGASFTWSANPATIDLSTVTGSADLSQGSFASNNNSLTLRANSTAGGAFAPGGSTLSAPASITQIVYTSNAPNVDMAAGSISGTLAVKSGDAPVAFGPAAFPLGGTLAATGTTNSTGDGTPVSTLPPYLSMWYFFVLDGQFPVRD